MNTDGIKATLIGILILCVGALCAYGGYMIRDSMEAPEVVTPKPEVRQADDSLIIERKPADKPTAKPPHKIPSGAVRERAIAVTVDPTKPPVDGKCPPVRVDLSLVRIGDGRRVIASSPDGRVVDAVDVPIERGMVPVDRKWAVGASYDPFGQSPGVWVERDIGRLRIGADLYQDRAGLDLGMAARIRVGWTF